MTVSREHIERSDIERRIEYQVALKLYATRVGAELFVVWEQSLELFKPPYTPPFPSWQAFQKFKLRHRAEIDIRLLSAEKATCDNIPDILATGDAVRVQGDVLIRDQYLQLFHAYMGGEVDNEESGDMKNAQWGVAADRKIANEESREFNLRLHRSTKQLANRLATDEELRLKVARHYVRTLLKESERR